MIPEFYTKETICQKFGANSAKYKAYGLLGHEGIDYGKWKVYPILLDTYIKVFPFIADGVIEVAGDIGKNYGIQYTVRSDNGDRWIYGHCSKLFHTVGERVSAGEDAGITGHSGRTTIDHLHLSWLPAGESINNGYKGCKNPMDYILLNKNTAKMEMPYGVGDRILTNTGRNTLGYRKDPSINGELLAVSGLPAVGRLPSGKELEVIGNSQEADGYLWIDVSVLPSYPEEKYFGSGWIAIKKADGSEYTKLYKKAEVVQSESVKGTVNLIKAKIAEINSLLDKLT